MAPSLQRPADLAGATLIRVTRMPDEWPSWLAAVGLPPDFRPASEVTFEDNTMAMQAALGGIGVAIAQLTYVRDALAANRLVASLRRSGLHVRPWTHGGPGPDKFNRR